MPSFTFDISDEVNNLLDSAIQAGGPGDFNPGQQAAWDNVTCDVSATATVRIAGKLVDVSTDISVKCTGADYISGAVQNLESQCEMLGESIEKGNYFLYQDLVDQAYDSL
jgi:hypothetical protein